MCLVLMSFPMLCADAPNPSLLAMANSTGRPMRRWDFAAIVTVVSVATEIIYLPPSSWRQLIRIQMNSYLFPIPCQ